MKVFWAILPEVLPSKWHSVPKVGLVLKPDVTAGLFHGGTAEWACLPARSRVTDDEWTGSGTCVGVACFPGLRSVTLVRNLKKIFQLWSD